MSEHLRRRESRKGQGLATGAVPAEGLLADLPALREFLTAAEWPDGEPRKTGTVLLFLGDAGRLQVMLNDRDQQLVAFLTGDSLEGLLHAANRAVVDEAADWRASRDSKAGRGGRR